MQKGVLGMWSPKVLYHRKGNASDLCCFIQIWLICSMLQAFLVSYLGEWQIGHYSLVPLENEGLWSQQVYGEINTTRH